MINKPRNQGFTIVELLVVITVILLLAALVLPALSRSRRTAIRMLCLNNLHQVSLASIAYADDWNGNFPVSNS